MIKRTLGLGTVAVLGLAMGTQADVTIGDFEGSDPGTWGYWSGGVQTPIDDDPSLELSTEDATTGSTSVKFLNSGWDQNLAYAADFATREAFTQNQAVQFDIILPETTTSGWWEVFEFVLNAEGSGFTAVTAVTNSEGGTNQVGWADGGGGRRVVTFTYDYTALSSQWSGTPGWVELVFAINNDGDHTVAYIDNVRLVPEPASLALLGLGGLAALARRRHA